MGGGTVIAVLKPSAPLDCKDLEAWLHVYLDDEASAEDRALVEAHLFACPACQGRARLFERMRRALKARALEEDRAPETLVERVRAYMEREARPSFRSRLLWAVPVAVAGAALVVAVIAYLRAHEEPAAPVVRRSIEHHRLDVPVDVASPDPEQVARFLAPRIGHAVDVPRFDRIGFGLAGGRVVRFADRPAAQLVYRGGLGRRLSVVAVPDPDGAIASRFRPRPGAFHLFEGQEQGFRVEIWSRGGTLYSLVADPGDEGMIQAARAMVVGEARP